MLGAEAHRDQLRGMVRPLRFIFWGGLICLIDINVDRFDVLNDLVGLLLIAVGVFRLGRIELTRSYSRAMGFVKVVCVLALAKEVLDYVVEPSVAWSIVSTLCNLVGLAAVLIFCFTMRLLCLSVGLLIPAISWRTTAFLSVFFLAIPLCVVHGLGLVATMTGSGQLQMGPAAYLLLIVIVPCIHFFVSTSRTARAAECEPFVREIERPAPEAEGF